jgi:hypothetical protein
MTDKSDAPSFWSAIAEPKIPAAPRAPDAVRTPLVCDEEPSPRRVALGSSKAPSCSARGLRGRAEPGYVGSTEDAARAGNWRAERDERAPRGSPSPNRACRSVDSPSNVEPADSYVGDAGEHLTFDAWRSGLLICHHLLGSAHRADDRGRRDKTSPHREKEGTGAGGRNESYRINRGKDTSGPAAPSIGPRRIVCPHPSRSFESSPKGTVGGTSRSR